MRPPRAAEHGGGWISGAAAGRAPDRPMSVGELRGRRIQDLLLHPWTWVLLAAVVGLVVGVTQGVFGFQATMRLGKFMVALAFFFVLVRFPLYVGVGLFLILYAFPARITIGTTNFVFIIFLVVVWAVRIGLRQEHRPRRTYLDWAIVAYLALHALSLLNATSGAHLGNCLEASRHLMMPILVFYVMVNVARTERRLFFLVELFTLGMMLVYFSAFMERFFPHVRWLPEWYLGVLGGKGLFAGRTVFRVGGVFTHPMLADTTAANALLQLFLVLHFKHRPWLRLYHLVVLLLSVYVVSMTSNRGGLLLLLGGGVYFLWVFSRELSWKRAFVGLLLVMALLLIGEMSLRGYEGNVTLLARMAETHVERGVPDTRQGTWAYIWGRIMERPFFGHGPFFNIQGFEGAQKALWPHNAYLYYLFTIGLVGLPTYLVLAGRLLKRTWVGRGLAAGEIPLARGLAAVFHMGALQFLLGQLRTDHQRPDPFAYYMWILFGLGILAREVWEDQKRVAAARRLPDAGPALSKPA
jgi:O-antigen ligase